MMTRDLTDFDIKVLRELNGEPQEDLVAGAALWQTAAYLRSIGLATGTYKITEKGKEVLVALDNINV